jgi:carbon monoxide dehydrogenase subunit G
VHRTEASIEIEAPPEAVFANIVDPAQRVRWVKGLVESEATGGSSYHEVVQDHGLKLEMDVRTILAQPPLAVDAHMTGRGFEATVRNRLEELEGGTRITVTVDTEYKGLAARLAAPVVTRHAQGSLEASLAALKEISEPA